METSNTIWFTDYKPVKASHRRITTRQWWHDQSKDHASLGAYMERNVLQGNVGYEQKIILCFWHRRLVFYKRVEYVSPSTATVPVHCAAAHLFRHIAHDPVLRECKKRPLNIPDCSGNIYDVDVASHPGCLAFSMAKVPNVVHDYALKDRATD